MIGEDVRGAGGVAVLARARLRETRAHQRRAEWARRLSRWLLLGLPREGTPSPTRHATTDASGAQAPHPRATSGTSGTSGTSNADGALRAEFERFFAASESQVSSYLYRVTGDTHLASDLSQETFFRAWQHFATLRTYEQPRAWLLRVATNLALQALRRRRGPVGSALAIGQLPGNDLPGMSDPARRFAEGDLVRETLLELSARPRAMLVLREVYGLSGEEIAAVLGMKPNAVKVALFRARAQFRETYVRKGGRA